MPLGHCVNAKGNTLPATAEPSMSNTTLALRVLIRKTYEANKCRGKERHWYADGRGKKPLSHLTSISISLHPSPHCGFWLTRYQLDRGMDSRDDASSDQTARWYSQVCLLKLLSQASRARGVAATPRLKASLIRKQLSMWPRPRKNVTEIESSVPGLMQLQNSSSVQGWSR